MGQQPRQFSRWKGVWAATDLPAFSGAWWYEPEALGGFLRPLPSLVIEGTSALLGDRAWALHALSILLHGLVAVLLAHLVRRMTGRLGIGILAGLIFLAWDGGRYHPLHPMELPQGEIRILADTSDLWASME